MSNNYVIGQNGSFISEEELYHHGIKGMKWGVRRYQNEDGTLTAAGKKKWDNETAKKKSKDLDKKRSDLRKSKDSYKQAVYMDKMWSGSAYSPFKFVRNASNEYRKDMIKARDRMDTAKKDYKTAKNEFKKNATVGQKMGRTAKSAAKSTAKAMATVGGLYLYDQALNKGKGTKAAKNAIRAIGMAAITFNAIRRGDTDIRWEVKK